MFEYVPMLSGVEVLAGFEQGDTHDGVAIVCSFIAQQFCGRGPLARFLGRGSKRVSPYFSTMIFGYGHEE